MSTEPFSSDLFESTDFWELHKGKILLYGSVLLIALAGYGFYEFRKQSTRSAAEAAFSKATTAEEYRSVLTDFPRTRLAGNAALELADKLRGEKKADEAVAVLREFIAKFPNHPLIAGAWVSLAAAQEAQGKPDEALESYQEAAAKFPNSYAAPLAMNAQARLQAEKGNKEAASRLYENVAARYPDSVYAREAMHELRFLKR